MNVTGLTLLPISGANPALGAETARDISGVLSGQTSFQLGCARLGDRYDLNPFAVAMFFANAGQLLPVLRPEPSEDRISVLGGLLEGMSGRTQTLGEIGSFLVGDDWHRRPYRTRQTLFEALDIAAMGVAVYHSLGVDLPDQPVINIMNVVADQTLIARHPLSGTEGALELRTGANESHGGLQFSLVLGENELVAKVGIQMGTDTISVVQLQGGGKRFSVQRQRLGAVLEGVHPFDWILSHLMRWAVSAGFHRFRGCGYRLNSSLDKHLRAGELPDSRRGHFQRIYDDRFVAFGLKAHSDLPDVYEIPLENFLNDELPGSNPLQDLMSGL